MESLASPILEHLTALADPIRVRMLLCLERHELTVTEICTVLQLPQSTVSRHLKTLADDGWVVSRRDGTSRYYGMADEGLDPAARGLWPLIRQEMARSPGSEQDARRLEGVLDRRRSKSEAFFSSASDQWDRLRGELFGDRVSLQAFVALADSNWVVGDLGCGTGQMTAALAPYVARVVAIDGSAEMLGAARARLQGQGNVDIRQGVLEALPLSDDSLDVAILSLVLHHQPDPARVLTEAGRVLKPGGRVLVVDMFPHDRVEYQQQMGHVWLGFSEETLRRQLGAAGFGTVRVRPLPVDTEAQGPALFVATAQRAR